MTKITKLLSAFDEGMKVDDVVLEGFASEKTARRWRRFWLRIRAVEKAQRELWIEMMATNTDSRKELIEYLGMKKDHGRPERIPVVR